MLIEVRFRGLAMATEEIDTVKAVSSGRVYWLQD